MLQYIVSGEIESNHKTAIKYYSFKFFLLVGPHPVGQMVVPSMLLRGASWRCSRDHAGLASKLGLLHALFFTYAQSSEPLLGWNIFS